MSANKLYCICTFVGMDISTSPTSITCIYGAGIAIITILLEGASRSRVAAVSGAVNAIIAYRSTMRALAIETNILCARITIIIIITGYVMFIVNIRMIACAPPTIIRSAGVVICRAEVAICNRVMSAAATDTTETNFIGADIVVIITS